MRPYETIPSGFTEKLFHENEVRQNKRAAVAVLVLGFVHGLMGILSLLELYEFFSHIVTVVLLMSAFLNFLAFFYCKHLQYTGRIIKSLLLLCITITAAIEFFFYPLNSTFLAYGPIIISALYFDPRLTRNVSWTSWICYSILLWLNVILEFTSPLMQEFHAMQEILVWKYPMDILLYRFIPHTILLWIIYFVCIAISKSGRRLIMKNAEEAQKSAINNAEFHTAAGIQRSSLPASHFEDPETGVHIETFMRPMKAVGGDFYDYFYMGSDIVVLVSDVSDKGLPAAMFMMKAKNALWSEINSGKSLEDAVANVNHLLVQDNQADMFVTAWVASVNIHTGVGKFINCGHLFPLVRHSDGTVTIIENEPNQVLGVFENNPYPSGMMKLRPGDTLVLYTDGMTDALNLQEEDFGEDRLKEVLKHSETQSAFCEKIVSEIDAFSNGHDQFDDMTLLTLSLNPTDTPSEETLTLTTSYDSIEHVMDATEKILLKHHCPDDVRRNMNVVIDELCTNITDYAYGDESGEFEVKIEAGANYLKLLLIDSGIAFDPTENMQDPTGEVKIGGLGLGLVKNLVDEFSYTRENETNCLQVVKIWREE